MNEPKSEEVIFCNALDQPINQRAEYLNEVCADDPELLASVKALLQIHETDKEFLATPVIGLAPDELYEKPGDRIGSYLLEELIGEGGFGVVWQARQLEPIQRKVALKIVRLGMDSKNIVRRFGEERQTLALMNHPNIATVLDAGVAESGRPFFAMELVDGESLDQFCKKNELSVRQQLEIFVTVCRAVQHAHQKGIIHRDLKPSNILVKSCDGEHMPKVIDFGISTAIRNDNFSSRSGSGHGMVAGTPQFMSPEQRKNESDVDTRSDVYSLGVVLHRLIAAPMPAVGKRPTSRDLNQSENSDTNFDTVQPGKAIANASNLSADLNGIIDKAMNQRREDRYQSASELALDVERYLCGEVVTAHSGGALYRFRKFAGRNRFLVTSGLTTLAALVVAIVASTWGLVHANHQKDIADAQKLIAVRGRNDAETLKEFAEAEARKLRVVANVLKTMLPEANPYRGMKSGFQIRENLDKLINSVDALSSEPELEAELRVSVARIYENLSRFGRARLQYSKARDIRKELNGENHPKTMTCVNGMASCNINLGKLRRAEALVHITLERSKEHAPRVYITSMRALRKIRDEQQRFSDAFEIAEQCLELSKDVFANEIFGQVNVANEYGISARKIGKVHEAEQVVRNALEVLEQDHPTRVFVIANTKHRLAEILIDLKRYDEAKLLAQSFVELQSETLGENDEYVIMGLVMLAKIHRLDDEPLVARQFVQDAVSRAEQLDKDQYKIRASTYRELAKTLTMLNPEKALDVWETAIKYRRQHYGSHVLVAQDLLKLSLVLRQTKRIEQAATVTENAIAILEKSKPEASSLPPAYVQYSELLAQLGENERAKDFAIKARELQEGD